MSVRGKSKMNLPGCNHKTVRPTDKCVQAEMKNKRETARYQLNCKVLDRQSMHTKFLIDKEKKISSKFLSDMNNTTGISTEGLAPEGPWDREHEKSPYFHGSMVISDKRRKRWRVTERQIQKQIKPVEEEKPEWQQESESQMKNKIQIVMGMMGYEDEDVEKLFRSIETRTDKPSPKKVTVRERNNRVKQLSDMVLQPYRSVPDVFECLRQDEELDNESYQLDLQPNNKETSLLSMQRPKKFSVKKWEKSFINDYAIKIARSPRNYKRVKSAPSSFNRSHDSANACDIAAEDIRNKNPRLVRPHSSSTIRRAKVENRIRRPKTAGSLKGSPTVRSPRTYNKIVNKPIWSNFHSNEAYTISPSTKEKIIKPEGILSNNLNTNSDLLKNNNEMQQTSTQKSTSLVIDCQTEDNYESFTHETDKVKQKRVSFSKTELLHGNNKTLTRRASFSVSNTMQKNESDLFVRSQSYTEENSVNKVVSNRRSSINNPSYLDAVDNEQYEDIFENVHDANSIPRWQRDLIREAPPGVFSPKTTPQVKVIMSKSQRRRELKKLTDHNASDVKTICSNEHERRRQSRANIFVTMMKVKQAVDTLKNKADESRKSCQDQGSIDSYE